MCAPPENSGGILPKACAAHPSVATPWALRMSPSPHAARKTGARGGRGTAQGRGGATALAPIIAGVGQLQIARRPRAVYRDLHTKTSAKSRATVAQNHGLQRIFGKIPTPMAFCEPNDRTLWIKNAA
jgi:hypothetical protein